MQITAPRRPRRDSNDASNRHTRHVHVARYTTLNTQFGQRNLLHSFRLDRLGTRQQHRQITELLQVHIAACCQRIYRVCIQRRGSDSDVSSLGLPTAAELRAETRSDAVKIREIHTELE